MPGAPPFEPAFATIEENEKEVTHGVLYRHADPPPPP